MGRDTGIILNSRAVIPFWVRVDRRGLYMRPERAFSVEICYWRNQHRLARALSDEFRMAESNYGDYEMTCFDVATARAIIKQQIRYGIGYTLRERLHLIQDYINLTWLLRLAEARPVEIIYYDSF